MPYRLVSYLKTLPTTSPGPAGLESHNDHGDPDKPFEVDVWSWNDLLIP